MLKLYRDVGSVQRISLCQNGQNRQTGFLGRLPNGDDVMVLTSPDASDSDVIYMDMLLDELFAAAQQYMKGKDLKIIR